MNILFFYHLSLDPLSGGIERVSNVLADYFESFGHNVFFLSRIKTSDYKCDRQKYLISDKNYSSKDNIDFFKEYLLVNNINIIINQSGISKEASKLVYNAKKLNIAVISVIHNALIGSIKNFSSVYHGRAIRYGCEFLLPYTDIKFIKKILLFLYKIKYINHYKELCIMSDRIVLLSKAFLPELEFFVGNKYRDRIVGISNPTSFRNDNFSVDIINKKKKEVLYVGAVNFSEKRVDLLLHIWSRIYKKYPDWILKIVGGGNKLSEAKNLSSVLKLKNLYFEDIQDPKRYYEEASIFCMTSSCEGFGIVLVEAMQHAVVPIAFDSYASVKDIIDTNKNGLLVSPFDLDEYVEKLSKLMKNEIYRKKLSEGALNKSKEFSIEKIGDEWLKLFEELN